MGQWRPRADARQQFAEWRPGWWAPRGEWVVSARLSGGKRIRQVRWQPDPEARQPDWPADPDPTNPDFRLGCIPPPCDICTGQLLRWVSSGSGPTITYYDLRHYRGPHDLRRGGDDENGEVPEPAPTRSDEAPDLVPALEVV